MGLKSRVAVALATAVVVVLGATGALAGERCQETPPPPPNCRHTVGLHIEAGVTFRGTQTVTITASNANSYRPFGVQVAYDDDELLNAPRNLGSVFVPAGSTVSQTFSAPVKKRIEGGVYATFTDRGCDGEATVSIA